MEPPAENAAVKLLTVVEQTLLLGQPPQGAHDQRRAHDLRKSGRGGGSLDAPLENDHKEQVERNVGYDADEEVVKRTLGVSHRAQDAEMCIRDSYDAFCVFDADNIADEQFLARMNDAFCAGAQVCKGAMRAKNPYDSWLSGCYGLYFTLFDTFFSRARMSCGLSSKLVGTGFAVHRAVLERFGGWNTSTIAEDAEFAAQCAANGVRVCFVPGALTYDEAPNDFAVSLRQRRRWCSGIMDVAVRMDAPLVSALRGSAPLRALDALLIVNAPFLQALTLLPLTLTILSSLVQGTAGTLALTGAVSLTLSTLGLMALAALLAYLGGYRDRRVVRTVAGFPLFMAAWLPLQLVSLVSRTRSWQPIAHTRAVRAENLHDAGFLTTI